MTCVAGLEHGGRVYLAGDSAVSWSSDDSVFVASHRKIVRRGGMLIGFSGNLSISTVFSSMLSPEPYSKGDPRTHILTAVILPLRDLLREIRLDADGTDMLIACAGRLWFAGVDGSIHGYRCGYAAIGSGAPHALGSLYSTKGKPTTRVKLAVQAAVEHCSSVCGPVYAMSI